MLNLKKCRAKNENICNKEYSTSNFIPYYRLWDDDTVLMKQNWLLKVVKVEGYSFETADDEDVDIRKNIRNQLLRGISSGSFALYFHIIRRRQNACSNNFANSRLQNYFADNLNRKWVKKSSGSQSFVNDLYITIIRKHDNKGVAVLEHLFKKLNRAASQSAFQEDMKDSHEELNEITNRVAASLRDYSPKILGVERTKDGVYSEILEFFSKILNCGISNRVLVPKMDLAEYLPSNRLYFGDNAIEIIEPSKVRYAGLISLKEYGQSTSAGMLDVFLQLPYEFIITQSFQFTNKQIAINKMQLQQNRMIQSEDKAISQIAEISKALDDSMSGRIAFGEHHLTILCVEDSIRALEGAISLADAELINTGVYSVREKINMEPVFWAQLPGNFDFIVRKSVINTLNLAGFVSLHNYPTGKKFNNYWGEAVTILETTSGTPFFFNFHVRDVGHTTIIGPTGAGKTVLMNFFMCTNYEV